jgi:hypothetical protein
MITPFLYRTRDRRVASGDAAEQFNGGLLDPRDFCATLTPDS